MRVIRNGDQEAKSGLVPSRGNSKAKVRDSEGPPRPNLYDEGTARIIGELEGGRIPWAQPWGAVAGGEPAMVAMPRNALTNRNYSGINVLIL